MLNRFRYIHVNLAYRSSDEDIRHRALTRDGLKGILDSIAVFYLVQFNDLLQKHQHEKTNDGTRTAVHERREKGGGLSCVKCQYRGNFCISYMGLG